MLILSFTVALADDEPRITLPSEARQVAERLTTALNAAPGGPVAHSTVVAAEAAHAELAIFVETSLARPWATSEAALNAALVAELGDRASAWRLSGRGKDSPSGW